MFTILDSLVDAAIVNAHFACDLAKCHGACCTMPGGRGAPLTDPEVEHVMRASLAASEYLDERKKRILEEDGGIEGSPGDYATRCVDDRDCVYVYHDSGTAYCSIERAWIDGLIEFRKPLSCHLFPIRIHDLFDMPYLHYERIDECRPAIANGRRGDIRLLEFLRDPIVRAFGEEYYDELRRQKREGTGDTTEAQ